MGEYSAWVNYMAEKEKDKEREWLMCGYCLVKALDDLKATLPALEHYHCRYQAKLRAETGRFRGYI